MDLFAVLSIIVREKAFLAQWYSISYNFEVFMF